MAGKAAIVIGAGDALGGAIARRFAREGFAAVIVPRHAWIAENFPDRHKLKTEDGILNPEHVADAYWGLHSQPRDAWTHELDLRPWMEAW